MFVRALRRRHLSVIGQALSLVGPAVYSFLLYDPSKANINTYVRLLTFGFTWGYAITFALELAVVRDRASAPPCAGRRSRARVDSSFVR